MSLMAISRHMQVLLTFSGLASILTQKTAMSLACLNYRICLPFMSLTAFSSPFSAKTALLWTPPLLPSVYCITAV